jgi:hypothetical protein
MTSETANELHAVWGTSGADVFAIGNSATVLHHSYTVALSIDRVSGKQGGTVSLSAKLTADGFPLSGGGIAFAINGAVRGTAITDYGGVATLTDVSLADLATGRHDSAVEVRFSGDPTYVSMIETADLMVYEAGPISGGRWASIAGIVAAVALAVIVLVLFATLVLARRRLGDRR